MQTEETKDQIQKAVSQQELADQLETITDRHGLSTTLDALALMCSEKADHIRTNWQDEGLADMWDRFTGYILKAENDITEDCNGLF